MAGADDNEQDAAEVGIPDALEKLLHDLPTDEKSGANASLGFAYQHWWGALAVAELLASNDDFAVGMEVKEDVVILDSSISPTAIEFCQIKKNETAGGWKLADLHKEGRLKADKTRDLSPLAKLYKRRREFVGHPTKLRFVSNLGVKIGNDDGSESVVSEKKMSELCVKDRNAVCKRISSQIDIDESEVDLGEFVLHRTDLPMGQQYVFVAGKLAELCESGSLPFDLTEPTVAARVLASVLQGKANSTSYASNFEELKDRLMTKTEALELLVRVAKAKSTIKKVLDEAIARLDIEAHDYFELKEIKAERISVLAHAVDRTNTQFQKLAAALFACQGGDKPADGKLGSHMIGVTVAARLLHSEVFHGLSRGYVYCVCLLVVSDGIDINVLLVEANSESEAEA